MSDSFIMYNGDTIFADGEHLLVVNYVLDSPFHITVTPKQPQPRRIDMNSPNPIKVIGESVYLKVGEPLHMDGGYSIMATRIYNHSPPYCRISVRSPNHVTLTCSKTNQGN